MWIAAAHGETAPDRLREVSEAGYLRRLFVRERSPFIRCAVQRAVLESNDDYVTVHATGPRRTTWSSR